MIEKEKKNKQTNKPKQDNRFLHDIYVAKDFFLRQVMCDFWIAKDYSLF